MDVGREVHAKEYYTLMLRLMVGKIKRKIRRWRKIVTTGRIKKK